METFLKEAIEGQNFELLIDAKIFSKDIILKSAYNFLDKGYFFFRHDDVQNIILQFTKKSDVDTDPKIIIGEYSDELLDVYLRDKLEKDNKVIREAIVEKAINGPLDTQNFVSLDTGWNSERNQIDFDKDIDEILKDIENDPELKIDEEEIENILKEIEQETSSEISKPELKVDPAGIAGAKDIFKNKNK